jgi:hypothetical protein
MQADGLALADQSLALMPGIGGRAADIFLESFGEGLRPGRRV